MTWHTKGLSKKDQLLVELVVLKAQKKLFDKKFDKAYQYLFATNGTEEYPYTLPGKHDTMKMLNIIQDIASKLIELEKL
jgi:hypothetical protein